MLDGFGGDGVRDQGENFVRSCEDRLRWERAFCLTGQRPEIYQPRASRAPAKRVQRARRGKRRPGFGAGDSSVG